MTYTTDEILQLPILPKSKQYEIYYKSISDVKLRDKVCKILNLSDLDFVKELMFHNIVFYHKYEEFILPDKDAYELFTKSNNKHYNSYFIINLITTDQKCKFDNSDYLDKFALYADYISDYLDDYTLCTQSICELYSSCKEDKSKLKIKKHFSKRYNYRNVDFGKDLFIIEKFIKLLGFERYNIFKYIAYNFDFDLQKDQWFIKKYKIDHKQILYSKNKTELRNNKKNHNCVKPVGEMIHYQNLMNL